MYYVCCFTFCSLYMKIEDSLMAPMLNADALKGLSYEIDFNNVDEN